MRKERKMATPKVQKIPVNEEKFRNILNKRGLTQAEVCRAMYKSVNTIHNSFRRGHFSGRMADALVKEWNITPEMYAPDPVVETKTAKSSPAQPVQAVFSEEFYDRIYNVVFHAVYDACKKAWNE
jgi:hypothetical protein